MSPLCARHSSNRSTTTVIASASLLLHLESHVIHQILLPGPRSLQMTALASAQKSCCWLRNKWPHHKGPTFDREEPQTVVVYHWFYTHQFLASLFAHGTNFPKATQVKPFYWLNQQVEMQANSPIPTINDRYLLSHTPYSKKLASE